MEIVRTHSKLPRSRVEGIGWSREGWILTSGYESYVIKETLHREEEGTYFVVFKSQKEVGFNFSDLSGAIEWCMEDADEPGYD